MNLWILQIDTTPKISEIFDDLASILRTEHPELDQLSTRKRALTVVKFLRNRNLTGLATELAYRDLQNTFIGIALQDQDHPSLPLISVAIFCVLAQRVGIDARCCGIPNHVHAIVFPVHNETLDGRPLSPGDPHPDPMYLDPYRSETEVPIQLLRRMLLDWGLPAGQHAEYLRDSSTANVILRTSKNILATVHDFRAHHGDEENTGHPTIRLRANPFADLDNAFYAALWANYIFGHPFRRSEGYQTKANSSP